ncbi:MAG: cupin domain-containing protein [Nitrospirales bacterium]|nr:cupin domain-containing protein [Nitrospira sp.]MDR4459110.1 cupin domain-containing protein [Nitrospirales bacterium]MDR4483429.1 cupin domain-containing protein [Nitrospirales bacterium]
MEIYQNLFANIPEHFDHEFTSEVLRNRSVRIERIVSRGQASPPDFWYDQAEHECVVVLAGKARLKIDRQPEIMVGPGDILYLAAHTKHRVEWTDPQQDTIWLAVFWKD